MNKKAGFCLTLLLTALLLMTVAGCGRNEFSSPKAVELTVSAAASLTDCLQELQGFYEGKTKNVKLNLNFGASGVLRQQIEQGAPADLFISADAKTMKMLADKQLLEDGRYRTLLANRLVLIVPTGSTAALAKMEDLVKAEIKKIAVGAPETVPAGNYAKEALTNDRLWDVLQPKIVLTKDVRQVLTYVETGNVDAGFVYQTDALTTNKVRIAVAVNSQSYKPIEYPAAVVKTTKHKNEAQQFYQFLFSKEAQDVLVKYGFSIPRGRE